MKLEQIELGKRIRTLVAFSGVPRGTEGVIDEDYGTGFMVAWDLPHRPLPPGHREFTASGWSGFMPLRDGFNKERELQHLEIVGDRQ